MDKTTTCHHVWRMAETGNAMFRWKACYHSRDTANSAARRWRRTDPAYGKADRPGSKDDVYMVRKCDPKRCPCACARERV